MQISQLDDTQGAIAMEAQRGLRSRKPRHGWEQGQSPKQDGPHGRTTHITSILGYKFEFDSFAGA